jgi:ribonuclease HII
MEESPMLIAGLDEAGRGAALGPLVIAGVLVKEGELPRLKELGVKDSKLLSPRRREMLAVEVKKLAQGCSVAKLQPREIDVAVRSGRKLHKLNRLEAQTMARVIEALKPNKVFVDAADVLEDRFKYHILECMSFRPQIISEHRADKNYVVVSAASIIAKVERDREIALLTEAHGDIGSGYPSDPRTSNFLRECLKKAVEYPDFVRKSWKPVKKAKSEKGSYQVRLI